MGSFNGLSTQWMEDVEYIQWPVVPRGGQHVGYSFGVLAHHKPTGICVVSMDERSQWKNREAALEKLRSTLDKLYPEAT